MKRLLFGLLLVAFATSAHAIRGTVIVRDAAPEYESYIIFGCGPSLVLNVLPLGVGNDATNYLHLDCSDGMLNELDPEFFVGAVGASFSDVTINLPEGAGIDQRGGCWLARYFSTEAAFHVELECGLPLGRSGFETK